MGRLSVIVIYCYTANYPNSRGRNHDESLLLHIVAVHWSVGEAQLGVSGSRSPMKLKSSSGWAAVSSEG